MFWKYHSGASSHIDTLLDKEEVTLTEVLEQEDIIQECKSQNKKLVEFLTKQEILSELLDLILQEPSPDIEERLRFKLPNIASEVLTCDVAQVNEKLSSDTALLEKMYLYLENPPPLNPLTSSFFSKAFGVLISRRPEQNWYSYQYTCLQIIEFIKSKPRFTELLMTHLGTSAIMDLLLRLITMVEGTENKQNILSWLNEEKLIHRILSQFSPDGGGQDNQESGVTRHEQHDNAGQLLVEIIRSCRDAQLAAAPAEKFNNPLLMSAESVETVETLLGFMLDQETREESVIVNSVEVLLSLLEVRRPAPQGGFYPYSTETETTNCTADIERQEAVVVSTVECIVKRLGQITQILISPPAKPPVATTAGVLKVPLGKTRLWLIKLISAMLNTKNPALNQALAEANVLTVLIDLFFEYSLNNFLHAQVESCVRSVIFWSDKKTADDELEKTAEIDTEKSSEDNTVLETPKIELESQDKKESAEEAVHPLDESIVFQNPALTHLLTNAGLIEKLIKVWSNPVIPPTVAYMGHVTRITNDLVTACGTVLQQQQPPTSTPEVPCPSRTMLLQLFAKLPEETQDSWKKITEGRLVEVNNLNEIKPATEDKRTLSSDDDDADFHDIQFPQDSAALEKMFSDYQMQEMSENFIDSFGFQDNEFTESDMNVSRGMRKLHNGILEVQAPPNKHDVFSSACEKRIKTFGGDDDDQDEEDPWHDKTAELSWGGTAAAKHRLEDDDSDDSDDTEAAPTNMEVDNDDDPWAALSSRGEAEGAVAMDTNVSPWDAPPASGDSSAENTAGAGGWANFGGFTSNNDSASSDIIENQQSEVMNVEDKPEDDGGESWAPRMASSPEATMLDCPETEQEESDPTSDTKQVLETALQRLEDGADDDDKENKVEDNNDDKKCDKEESPEDKSDSNKEMMTTETDSTNMTKTPDGETSNNQEVSSS